MNSFSYLLVYTIIASTFSIVVVQNQNSSRHFTFHGNEDKVLLQLPEADNAVLIERQNGSYCRLTSKYLHTETKQFKIIKDNEFLEDDFEYDTPLNFRSFISMAQITDGIIAITSDLLLYQFQFNYDIIYKKDSNQQFATVSWKADFQRLSLGLEAKSEFAQVVYCQSSDQVLIIFSKVALMFSVQEMELNNEEIKVYTLGNWISRQERGLTKELKNIVFSAVGPEGCEIYQVSNNDIVYLKTLNKVTFKMDEFYLKDFTVVHHGKDSFRIHFLEVSGKVLVVDITIKNYIVDVTVISTLDSKGSGIAIDTKNGEDIFVAYQDKHIYLALQYYLSLVQYSTPITVNEYQTYSEIKDIDVTDEFAILQGQNHHKILFANPSSNTSVNLPVFNHIGLRDFEFFTLTRKNLSSKISDEQQYQYDDFFFGITANTIFLTRFSIQPIQIKCLHNQDIDPIVQSYILIYNVTTDNSQLGDPIVVQNTLNFTVQITKTYFFQNELNTLYILIGLIIFLSVSVITFWLHTYNKEIQQLEDQVGQYAVSRRNNQIEMINSDRRIVPNLPPSKHE